jgi:DNA-binding MarR family transcriptional regulator
MTGGRQKPPAGLARWTGFQLAWVAAIASARYEEALRAVKLTLQQLGILTLLQDGPMIQSRLSEALGVFKPVMVGLANELEAQHLVERRPHPVDQRALELHLLPAGAARIAAATVISRAATDAFLAPLTPAEQDEFRRLLGKLADHDTGEESGD